MCKDSIYLKISKVNQESIRKQMVSNETIIAHFFAN